MTGSGSAAGERPASGSDDVRAALSPLGRLAHTPVSAHVGVFEEVLTGLEAVLASVEEGGERSITLERPENPGNPENLGAPENPETLGNPEMIGAPGAPGSLVPPGSLGAGGAYAPGQVR